VRVELHHERGRRYIKTVFPGIESRGLQSPTPAGGSTGLRKRFGSPPSFGTSPWYPAIDPFPETSPYRQALPASSNTPVFLLRLPERQDVLSGTGRRYEYDMKILIMDGNSKSSLAATRSLGEKGITVVVGEEFGDNLSAASKYCSKSYTYPSPYTDSRKFIDCVKKIIAAESIDLVLPMTDITMENVLAAADEFSPSLLRALPSYRSYALLTDKINMLQLASGLGVPIPEFSIIKSKDELVHAAENIQYPVIVKPMRSKLLQEGRFVSTSVQFAETREKLLSLYENNEYLKEPFMEREYLLSFITASRSYFFLISD
jgi:hypothetical protein